MIAPSLLRQASPLYVASSGAAKGVGLRRWSCAADCCGRLAKFDWRIALATTPAYSAARSMPLQRGDPTQVASEPVIVAEAGRGRPLPSVLARLLGRLFILKSEAGLSTGDEAQNAGRRCQLAWASESALSIRQLL